MPVATLDKIDLLFRAFADPTRLRILNLLVDEREICVCDLVSVLDLPQAKVSRHLAYLRKARLVTARKELQWMHYTLAPATGKFHSTLIQCLSRCMSEVPTLVRDRKQLRRRAPGGPGQCCD